MWNKESEFVTLNMKTKSVYFIVLFLFGVLQVFVAQNLGYPFHVRTQPLNPPKDTILQPEIRDSKKEEFIPFADFDRAVDMIGFEKRLTDRTETFLIRNNTEHLITRIKVKLVYKTPKNQMISYREVIIDGEILPHTTRQFEVDSFDKAQRYYYVQSKANDKAIREGYPFKLAFSLLRYDIAITRKNE